MKSDRVVADILSAENDRIAASGLKVREFQATQNSFTSSDLLNQIFQLLTFVYGTLNQHEKYLYKLLREFYAPPVSSPFATINFMEIHNIQSLRDVLYLFPGKF